MKMSSGASKTVVVHFAVSGGGVKKHIVEFAEGFDRDKFILIGVFPDEAMSKSVCKDPESRYRTAFTRLGLACHTFEIPRGPALWTDVKAVFALARLLRRLKADVLHCHSSKAGYIGRPAAFLAGIRAVCYTPHIMYYLLHQGLKRRISFLAEKVLTPLSKALIAVSTSEYEILRHDLKPGKRLIQINNGVKPFAGPQAGQRPDEDAVVGQSLRPDKGLAGPSAGRYDTVRIRNDYGLPQNVPIILSPTRCEPQKDVRTLVMAMEKVLKMVPEAVLVVAGEGSLRPGLEQLAAWLGLDERVRFLGWVDRLEELMFASDIVALSSVWEGLPYAVLEASAMGKPTVGSDVPGNRDCIRDGESGFLVTQGDVDGFAEKLTLLCLSPKMRSEMGRAGQRMVAEDFNCDIMIKQLEGLYLDLAGRQVQS